MTLTRWLYEERTTSWYTPLAAMWDVGSEPLNSLAPTQPWGQVPSSR